MNQIVNVVDRNPLFRLLQSDELDLLIFKTTDSYEF